MGEGELGEGQTTQQGIKGCSVNTELTFVKAM